MFGSVYFFTATNLNWLPLLDTDERKQIITDSLGYMVKEGKAQVFAFVIMPNHFHVLWSVKNDYTLSNIQRDLLKFTAQKIKFNLQDTNDSRLLLLHSSQNDRAFQIWERRPKWKQVTNREMAFQKLNYIHGNPLQGKWNLCKTTIDYRFSSALFYETGVDDFAFLTHLQEIL